MKPSVIAIPLDQIHPNHDQPRHVFDDNELNALAASLKTNGLIQPITVRKTSDGYQIIAGERRYRAAIKAGWSTIDCYVKTSDELESATLALVENIQRVNLTSVEEAKAYQKLMDQYGLNQVQLAKALGKSQSGVANKLRLLNLPQDIQNAITSGILSERHGRALLSLQGKAQHDVYQKIVTQQLTVAQTEKEVKKHTLPKPKHKTKGKIRSFNKNQLIAINTIKTSIDMVKKSGFDIEYTLSDDPTTITLTITITK